MCNDVLLLVQRITVGDLTIWPDHYCELVGHSKRFPFFFEFDRSTETLRSGVKHQDTWSQKNVVYDVRVAREYRHPPVWRLGSTGRDSYRSLPPLSLS